MSCRDDLPRYICILVSSFQLSATFIASQIHLIYFEFLIL